MEFVLRRPGPPLNPLVETITWFDGYSPGHTRERLIPDGAVTLIVDLGDTPKRLFRAEYASEHVAFRRAWISGLQLRPIVIEAQARSSLLVIRFRPGGAYPVLGHDLHALTDDVLAFDAVAGAAASSLRYRVLERMGGDAKIDAAEAWLRERCAGVSIDPAVAHLARMLHRPQPGGVTALAEQTGYSARHVRDLFRRWIGVTPKQYARLQRFQHLISALTASAPENLFLEGKALPRPDWAALAADLCFSDQSHLGHEFSAFAAMSPGDYLSAHRGLPHYLPITVEADRAAI